MAEPLLYTAAACLLAMYADAKIGLREDLRMLSATKAVARSVQRAADAGTLSLFCELEKQYHLRPTADSLYYAPTGHQETWSETYAIVLRMSAFFVSKHVRHGDIVVVDYTNKPILFHIWMALNAIGAAPAFINYNLSGGSLVHCLKVSTARLMILDPDVTEKVFSSQDELLSLGLELVIFDDAQLQQIDALPAERPDHDPSTNKPTDPSCILYTSGTTGFPKPALYSIQRCYAAGLRAGRYLRLKPQDRFYTCMPLYHGTGNGCFLMCLLSGASLCLGLKFSVSNYWDDVRRSRATVINYVGETCRYLLSAPPSPTDRDNLVHSAYGNGLRPDIWEAFRERFGIANIMELYGASEALVSLLNYNSGPYGVGYVGTHGLLQRFLTRNDLLAVRVDLETQEPLRNKAGFCEVVGSDEPGELLMRIRDPAKFAGYYRNAEATKKKVLEDVLERGDQWFRSGDLMGRNKDGMWYFVDRMGDTFRWKSENVSTMEVAGALSSHPGFEDVNVYGVALPRHDGRAGCAAIVLSPGFTPNMRDLARHAIGALPKYAVPLFLRFTKDVHKTENNKQVKGILKSQGVDPKKVSPSDTLYWLEGGVALGQEYVEFMEEDWKALETGQLRL